MKKLKHTFYTPSHPSVNWTPEGECKDLVKISANFFRFRGGNPPFILKMFYCDGIGWGGMGWDGTGR